MKKRLMSLGVGMVLLAVGACQGFDEQLMYNNATRLHNSGQYAEAIQLYQKILNADPQNKIHPDNGIVAYDLGMAYLDSRNRKKAEEQVVLLEKIGYADLAKALRTAMRDQDMK